MVGALHWRSAGIIPRIAVVSHTHPSVSKGGAEIAAYTLFRGLRSLGIETIFIAGCAETDRVRLQFETPYERAIFYDPQRYDHLYHTGSATLARELARILHADGIGLTVFHHYLFLGLSSLRAAKRLPGMQVALTLHEYLAICQNHGQMVTRSARVLCEVASSATCQDCFPEFQHTQLSLRRAQFMSIFENVDWFISPSEFLASRYEQWGIKRARIGIIENGLRGFHKGNHRVSPRVEGAPWIFGYFGQINQFKGVDVLLRACDLIASDRKLAASIHIRVHGNLVGQTTAFVEKFEAAAAGYPFFSYAGAYTNSTVRRLMDACDYVLVPSTWWENSPLVIQEAYAARRPVLCSGIGGMAEKVPHGVTGLHFRPSDPLSLVHSLRQAINKPLYDKLQRAIPDPIDEREMARRYLQHFGLIDKTQTDAACGSLAPDAPRPGYDEALAASVQYPSKVRGSKRTRAPQGGGTQSKADDRSATNAAKSAAPSSTD